MKHVNKLATLTMAAAFALVGFSATSHAAPANHAARKAAAEKCGMPKRGEGRPTAEQEACMTAAGFSKPTGGHHRGGKKGERPPPPPNGETPPADEPAAE